MKYWFTEQSNQEIAAANGWNRKAALVFEIDA